MKYNIIQNAKQHCTSTTRRVVSVFARYLITFTISINRKETFHLSSKIVDSVLFSSPRLLVLVIEMSSEVVFSSEAVLCTIDCVYTVCMGTVEASTVVLRLVSNKILLAGKGNFSSKTG
jgi:hypothetical protein